MKIAHFVDTFLPKMDGIVISLLNLTHQQTQKGHDVTIFAPKGKGSKKKQQKLIQKTKVYYYPSLNLDIVYPDAKLILPTIPRTLYTLKKWSPDIIHLHTPWLVGFDALICSKILHIPLIGTFHTFIADPAYLKSLKIIDTKITRKLVWQYNNFYYRSCDIVTAPSQAACNLLQENKLKKEIKIVSNSILWEKFQQPVHSPSFFKNKYDLQKNVIAYWGRTSPEKSIDLLIKAFHIAQKEIPPTSLLIIGKGPALIKLKKLTRELNISEKVVFTGEIENEKLISSGLLHTADIYATMSKTETQGLTSIEAMACGLPILVIDQKGSKELVQDNGFLIKEDDYQNMAEKMIYLLKKVKERISLGEKSWHHAKKYDASVITDTFEQIYLQAKKKKGKE